MRPATIIRGSGGGALLPGAGQASGDTSVSCRASGSGVRAGEETLDQPAYAQFSDEDLVGRCLAGERSAWTTLLARYERLIYAIPTRYGLPESDRLDVFQTVCVRLLEKLGTLRDRRSLARWIIATASRASWEQARRRPPDHGALADREEASDTDARLPPDEVAAIEERALLRVALDRLSPRARRVIELTVLSNPRRSYREVAEELGVPEGSVGPTRARCLAKLRLLLRDLGLDA